MSLASSATGHSVDSELIEVSANAVTFEEVPLERVYLVDPDTCDHGIPLDWDCSDCGRQFTSESSTPSTTGAGVGVLHQYSDIGLTPGVLDSSFCGPTPLDDCVFSKSVTMRVSDATISPSDNTPPRFLDESFISGRKVDFSIDDLIEDYKTCDLDDLVSRYDLNFVGVNRQPYLDEKGYLYASRFVKFITWLTYASVVAVGFVVLYFDSIKLQVFYQWMVLGLVFGVIIIKFVTSVVVYPLFDENTAKALECVRRFRYDDVYTLVKSLYIHSCVRNGEYCVSDDASFISFVVNKVADGPLQCGEPMYYVIEDAKGKKAIFYPTSCRLERYGVELTPEEATYFLHTEKCC